MLFTRLLFRYGGIALFLTLFISFFAVGYGVLARRDVIAFTSVRDGNAEIYLLDVERNFLRNMTHNRFADNRPVWSPDGEQLAYITWKNGNKLVMVDKDGNNPHYALNNVYSASTFDFSPDGSHLAMVGIYNQTGRIGLYILDIVGDEPQVVSQAAANEFNPNWSPDGSRLAYLKQQNGTSYIYIVDLASGERERLFDEAVWMDTPVWSPDGKQLAFSLIRRGNSEIYVMEMATRTMRNATNHIGWDDQPDWSPDGNRLMFVSNRNGDSNLFILDLASGHVQQITAHPADDYAPAWRP